MWAHPGYRIIEKLYESENTQVYRALREADRRPVILKVLSGTDPAPERVAWFQREHELLCNLNLPGVVGVYGLEAGQGHWVMVMEDFGGDSLARLGLSGRLPLSDFLAISIQIADAVGQIHHRRIIHKDVNPTNIILNPTTGQVKLVDFGIASVLSQENPSFRTPQVLEGTLAYMSPEQTGRMNRVTDYRTDLYSVGVTLYELLRGRLPYPTGDPLELLHSHIAKQPPVLHELDPAIPRPVSEIVLKLLAKNADDRYQSAHGLKADLEECLHQWRSAGRIDPFPPGRRDFSDHFYLPQKLYGREVERETLWAAFERTSRGDCEVVLVTGYAGIGETALVAEENQ